MAINPVGGERTIQSTSGGEFFDPNISSLRDGRFVVTWTDDGAVFDDNTRAQIVGTNSEAAFNIEGIPGNPSRWSASAQYQGTNDVAYAWTETDPFTGFTHIWTSVKGTNGAERVFDTRVEDNPLTPSNFDLNPEIVTHSDGSYVIAYDSWFNFDPLFGGDGDIHASRFDGNGNPLPFNLPFATINDANQQKDSAITALAGNRTVLVWSTNKPAGGPNEYGSDSAGFGLRAAIWNADGSQYRDVQLVNATDTPNPAAAGAGDQIEASTATLTNGDFVVVWNDNSLSKTDKSSSAIFGRVFDANGIPRGDSFLVNTTFEGAQSNPDVAALSGGGFAVTWTDASGPNTDVRVRSFGANGTPSDAQDMIVSQTVAGNQINSEIAAGANNSFMVTWEDESSAPNGTTGFFASAVRFRLFEDKAPNDPGEQPPEQPEPVVVPSISINNTAVTEGGVATLTLTLSRAATVPVSVNYATAPGSAGAEDFMAAAGSFTFAAGETTKTISIATTHDTTDEPNETFTVSLSNPSGGTVQRSVGTVTINDDDNPPVVVEPPLDVVFRGDNGPNNLVGNRLDNEMFGRGGNDRINGLEGDDDIHGGLGRDILTGGLGRDTFYFDTRPNKSTNWDKITDFRRQDDQIALESRYFGKLGDDVSNSELRLGKVAKDKNDYLIYDKGTGRLFYDADGSGSKAQVLFAQLTNKAAIKASDFDII